MAGGIRDNFTYLGVNIINNVALDKEMIIKSPKATSVMTMFRERIWNNGQCIRSSVWNASRLVSNLSHKMKGIQDRSTRLYASETKTI